MAYLIGQKFVGQNCRNSAWRRKFCPTKNCVRRKFCPMFQYKSQTKIGHKCRNFGLVSKILSDEIFCPSKILSDEILSDKVIALFTQLCEVRNECVFIATTRLCLNKFIYTPTRHHYDVTFFSDVIGRHHSLVCWEQYSIYIYAWKQNTLLFVSKTIQYLHSIKSVLILSISLYSDSSCAWKVMAIQAIYCHSDHCKYCYIGH